MIRKIDIYLLLLLAGIFVFSTWYNTKHIISVRPMVEEVPILKKDNLSLKKQAKNVPNFAVIMNVKEKKKIFFDFIREMVEQENALLSNIRKKILLLQKKSELHTIEVQWLTDIARRFQVDKKISDSNNFYDDLLNRVDIIPVSLALVQAANESSWGASRFAISANNYFGQWCFNKGCGLVPKYRPQGAVYEVRRFNSPDDSVRSYMHNLNTSHHYASMRALRSNLRASREVVTGPILAHELHAYSMRGADYIEELIAMIKSNNLLQYDLEIERLNSVMDQSL